MDYLTTLHQVEDIGSGAFGVVRRCAHDVHREVAAKFFFRANFDNISEWQAACERALAEGQALRALEHRNVVRIYDVVRSPAEDEFVIVMELCEQGSAKRFTESNEIHLPTVKKVVRDAAIGINYIHNRGYLHRDIKPDNILMTSDGEAKIGDFGFVTDKMILGFATPYGTPLYLAPEVPEMGCCTNITDIYSLGVTFLHLLHGEKWLTRQGRGQFFKLTDDGFPYLMDNGLFLPHIPTYWRTCINRLTRAEPGKRCKSMDEAVNLISRLPAVEDWRCVVGEDSVSWKMTKNGRVIRVLWEHYLSPKESWRAWSEDTHGMNVRTLAKNNKADTWKQTYRKLQDFFASRKP